MANIYVRSTDGVNTDNGSTWALAKLDIAGAAAIDAAGDRIWVSQSHAESTAAAISFAWAGSISSPTWVCCGNDGASPPTALATTATVTTTGNSSITVSSTNATYGYVYGINFIAGSGATGTASIIAAGSKLVMDTCTFTLATSGASSLINLSSTVGAVVYKNCGFKFGASGQGFSNGGVTTISGGSLLAGGTSPTNLVTVLSTSPLLIEGFDLSNASSTINMTSASSLAAVLVLRNCKLPASWSGSLHTGAPAFGSKIEMFNCDSADTHYRYRKAVPFGTIQDETTLVRTGGASDGTTTYSLKLVSFATSKYPHLTLDTPEIVKWNNTTGSAITATVEILFDSATALNDDEIWVEVMYLGTSGFPLASFISDAKADVLATAAAQTSSSATWTTTGMSNPNKRALSVTFTPQEAGFLHATVKLAKASTTVYVDPMMTIT